MRLILTCALFSGVTFRYEDIDKILKPLAANLAHEADSVLDLRDLLVSQGHPGKCVKCFFRIFEAAGREGAARLAPLRHWLEQNVLIAVRAGGRELETLPFTPQDHESLEDFCMRAIRVIRLDRGYSQQQLDLAFRYKTAA